MILHRLWHGLAQLGDVVQRPIFGSQGQVSSCLTPAARETLRFSNQWSVLGPFQIGTREAIWGADPLEYHGGFHALIYNESASFKSSLAPGGTIFWTNRTLNCYESALSTAHVAGEIEFPEIPWQTLRETYGWAALQWQAWLRGEIQVQADEPVVVTLATPQILEFLVDGEPFFGGDFYGYGRAPVVLRLDPGSHQIDVRLVRDVRSMGGIGAPSLTVALTLEASSGGLSKVPTAKSSQSEALVADVLVHGDKAVLASPYGSITLRNNAENDVTVAGITSVDDTCATSLLAESPVHIAPGQTRPVGFQINCASSLLSSSVRQAVSLSLDFYLDDEKHLQNLSFLVDFKRRSIYEPHRMTFLHPGAIVSYAVLRPPSQKVAENVRPSTTFPVLLQLHGAGLEADDDIVRLALDPIPDLHAWALFPTGGTPWSGDDWHAWGFADVMAAILSITSWIERMQWDGPKVDTDRWLISGHSNGGQGTWYILTHRPDNVLAAVPVSGYSSIQNYVPYVFWHPADPARNAIVQSALNSYRHELLVANARSIPILVQHGGGDDNVPPYNSRLLGQLLQEADVTSRYVEIPGQPHWWNGVMTTHPLRAFYDQHLTAPPPHNGTSLSDFSLTVANPGDTGSKNGLRILQLQTPGQLGKVDFIVDPFSLRCALKTSNVRMLLAPPHLRACSYVSIDGREHDLYDGSTWILESAEWRVASEAELQLPNFPQRYDRQLGAMDSILRTRGAFSIVPHSTASAKIALQISRNLAQYFAADSVISTDYQKALQADGNIISIAIGADLPPGQFVDHAIRIMHGSIAIRTPEGRIKGLSARIGSGIAAIYLRPLRLGRLELVVWASDEASLRIAARLVPLMTGTGQPDFIIADKALLAKGLEGTLALGFFDSFWRVSTNSFIA